MSGTIKQSHALHWRHQYRWISLLIINVMFSHVPLYLLTNQVIAFLNSPAHCENKQHKQLSVSLKLLFAVCVMPKLSQDPFRVSQHVSSYRIKAALKGADCARAGRQLRTADCRKRPLMGCSPWARPQWQVSHTGWCECLQWEEITRRTGVFVIAVLFMMQFKNNQSALWRFYGISCWSIQSV